MLTVPEKALNVVPHQSIQHAHPTQVVTVMPNTLPSGSSSSPLTLKLLWQRLMRQKWLFWLTLLTVLGLAALITWSTTPIYRAVSTIQIEKEGAQVVEFGETRKTTPYLGELDPFFRTQYEQLKSRDLANKVIQELNLDERLFNKKVETPLLQKIKTQTQHMLAPVLAFIKSDTVAEQAQERPQDNIEQFRENLYVEPVEKTHLVKIYYETPDAGLSAEIVNTLIKFFIRDSLTTESETDVYAQDFLEKELDKARVRLKSSEDAWIRYARDNGILESEGIQEKKLEDLSLALANAERQQIDARSKLQQARQHGNVAGVLTNPVIEGLKRQVIDLEAEYRNLSKVFKPGYPDMQRLSQQLASVRSQLNREIERIKQSLQAEYETTTQMQRALRKELTSYKTELVDLRDRSVEYNTLEREVSTSRKLYDDLLQRIEEVNIAAAATTSNVNIIDPASAPVNPLRPNKLLNLLIGLLCGLLLATGLALLREAFSEHALPAEELETLSGLQSLGAIPHVRKKSDNKLALAAVREVGSALAESYRIAATNIKFAIPSGSPYTLLVTSVNPGEGKSTSSINLALSKARMGHKVLLIDADLRRPTIHQKMDLYNLQGLGEYLSGDLDLAAITQHFREGDKSYVITAGARHADPLALLSSPKMRRLLELAQKHFDVTIIDAPPVTGFADALVLSDLSDATLLVTDAQQIDRARMTNTLTQLQRVKKNLIGFLMVNAHQNVVSERYYDRYSRENAQTHTYLPSHATQKEGINLGNRLKNTS